MPCECCVYFFYVNRLTCDIAHRKRGEKCRVSSEARMPCPEKRVKVVEGSQSNNACAGCIDELQTEDKSMNYRTAKARAKSTYLGCNVCEVYLCSKHWETFDHNPPASWRRKSYG